MKNSFHFSITGFHAVEYKASQYRVYRRILFWKTGPWKSMEDVHKIMIKNYAPKNSEEFQVYLVHKHSYDKVFASTSYASAKREAERLAKQYHLIVEEK